MLNSIFGFVDCTKIWIADANREPPENATAKFTLRAYVYKEGDKKVTAFNLTITDIDFNGKNPWVT